MWYIKTKEINVPQREFNGWKIEALSWPVQVTISEYKNQNPKGTRLGSI